MYASLKSFSYFNIQIVDLSALSKHTASGQALGYFFQLDRALVQIAHAGSGSMIGIETEDDIVVKLTNGEKIHEQDKSSVNSSPFIPSKPDIWKTLCIWCEAVQSEEINIAKTKFLLVTNIELSDCIAKQIHDAVDDNAALSCLSELKKYTVKTNKTNELFVERLFSYPDGILLEVIKKTSLLSGEITSGDGLKNDLFSSLQIVDGEDSDKISILNEIYGYLFNEVKSKWQKKEPAWIERDAIIRLKNNVIAKWIESFTNRRIFDPRDISDEEQAVHNLKTYVNQLKLIEADQIEILEAISDFLNSVEKRTQLAKKGYITQVEIDELILALKTRWKTLFKKIPLQYKHLSPVEVGKLVCLETLEHNAKIGRIETNSYFLTRGTYHHLSDCKEIGWHPEYSKLL